MSSPTSPGSSLRERLSLRREDRKVQAAASEPQETRAFLEAAAVLVDFDPERIQPAIPVVANVREVLSRFSQVVISGNQVRWTLNQGTRKQILQGLGNSEGMLKVLERNRGIEERATPEQQVYEQLMGGVWNYTLLIGERRLAAALQATNWLQGILPSLPDPDELRRRLDYARFTAPFERLAGTGFVGRTSELQKLHDYVGVTELRSSMEALTAVFRGWLLKSKLGPLLVYGPGGVGKSALIARFILDQDANRVAFGGFPIAYFDFDNSSLRLDRPETLVKEAFRQVALQYPIVTIMHSEFLAAYDRFVAEQEDVPSSPRSAERIQAQRFNIAMPFVEEWMGRLAHTRSDVGAPFLIVFDTFEEVIGRNRLAIEQILTLCTRLQQVYPSARLVISGRAVETSFGDDIERVFDTLPVADFETLPAQAYLVNQGVSDNRMAETIVKQLGGSPLTLRLAAEAVARGVEFQLSKGFNLDTKAWVLFSASETVIQGQLYERILGHIRNPEVPEVRQLAYPGLVLRRVTPEIISEVLAAPCRLDLPKDTESRERATQKLFDALRRESFLVDPRGVNSLRHRTDIRRVMLTTMEKKNRDLVNTIHQRAVDYYFKRGSTPEDRAEEIYHRLKLGQDPASVGDRWMAGVDSYLGDAIVEVPPRARLFLASRLGTKLEDEDNLYKAASLEEWELFAARKINEATTAQRLPDEILKILRERSERSATSPQFELEAAVLIESGRYTEAVQVLESAVNSVAAAGDRSLLGSLLDNLAFARTQLGQFDEADGLYQRAIAIARDSEDGEFLLATLLHRVNSARKNPQRMEEAIAQLSQVFLRATKERLRAVKRDALNALTISSPAQGPMILRAVEAGLFDDVLASRDTVPRVRELLALLLQESITNKEAVERVAKLLTLAQGPVILRAIEAGLLDDVLFSRPGAPRVKQLLAFLLQESVTNSEAIGKVSKLLLVTSGDA